MDLQEVSLFVENSDDVWFLILRNDVELLVAETNESPWKIRFVVTDRIVGDTGGATPGQGINEPVF